MKSWRSRLSLGFTLLFLTSLVVAFQNCGQGFEVQSQALMLKSTMAPDPTYRWTASTWSGCSNICGGGTQSRLVSCQSPEGLRVNEALCGTPAPEASQRCNEQACATYMWVQSGFSICSAACGGGTQTQTVVCKDSTGITVNDANCSGAKPPTTQACNPQVCEVFGWVSSPWQPCQVVSGVPVQTRTVSCQNQLGATVDETKCTGTRPVSSQSCQIVASPGSCSFYSSNVYIEANRTVPTYTVNRAPAGMRCEDFQSSVTCRNGALDPFPTKYSYISCVNDPPGPGPIMTWNKPPIDRGQFAVGMSADGKKIVMGMISLFVSSDGGISWKSMNPLNYHAIASVAVSEDGRKIFIAAAQRAAISHDGGEKWTQVTLPAGAFTWKAVMSPDGSKLAILENGGHIYFSFDNGVSWRKNTNIAPGSGGSSNWYTAAYSKDGSKLIVASVSSVNSVGGAPPSPPRTIYITSDDGNTWSSHYISSERRLSQVTALTTNRDGSQIAVIVNSVDDPDDFIYTSSDGGRTWVDRTSSAGHRKWYDIASSGDGKTLIAITNQGQSDGSPPPLYGWVFTSRDGGVTWTHHPGVSTKDYLNQVAISSDGKKAAIAGLDGYIGVFP